MYMAEVLAPNVSRDNKNAKERPHVYTRTGADTGTLFNQCLNLADTNPAAAAINPDNYRIFAEMSMSPVTKWKAPPPS
jgi:hypothetical protein